MNGDLTYSGYIKEPIRIKTAGGTAGSTIVVSNPSIIKGTAPSTDVFTNIGIYGNSINDYSNRLGLIEHHLNSNNLSMLRMVAYGAATSTTTTACEISCNVDASGNIYTYAPTPATNDNSGQIATTAFVKNQGYITGSGTAANINVYKYLGSDYVMNCNDFDKTGAIYGINSLSTASSINYPPSPYNTGDFYLFRFYQGNGVHPYVTLIGVTPRSNALYRCQFWNGTFSGWQVYDPTAMSS